LQVYTEAFGTTDKKVIRTVMTDTWICFIFSHGEAKEQRQYPNSRVDYQSRHNTIRWKGTDTERVIMSVFQIVYRC